MRRQWLGGLTLAVVFGLAGFALWLLGELLSPDPVLDDQAVKAIFSAATIVALSLAATVLTGHLLIALVVSGRSPTSFERAVVYGALSFIVAALLLAHFGFDLRTILTTSAIVTAAVGLAMQPTISSVISGLTVHVNGVVRVGDGVRHEGQWGRVVSMTWRSVVVEMLDHSLVVLPNNQMCDHVAHVARAGQPLYLISSFSAPITARPEWISDLVTEMVSDFAAVDARLPVSVAPTAFLPEHAATQYSIVYAIHDYWFYRLMDREVLRRLWYVFQRNGIVMPANHWYSVEPAVAAARNAGTLERDVRTALAGGGAHALGIDNTAENAAAIAEARLLLYAPDERLTLPADAEAATFLLVRGTAVPSHEFGIGEAELGRPALPTFRLDPNAAVRRVAERLASYIGPYAEIAVRRAAPRATGLATLCREVALEIDDAARRAQFLAEVEPPELAGHGPGLVFRARRNAAERLVCHLALRAQTELAVLALSPALLERLAGPAAPATAEPLTMPLS